MGDVLTSGDLYVGHNDLGQPILVDPTEANNNTHQPACLLVEDLCGNSNVPHSDHK